MSHSASKDVEMKDSTLASKVEDTKAPEPQDPFFGTPIHSYISYYRIQEGNGTHGESQQGQGL